MRRVELGGCGRENLTIEYIEVILPLALGRKNTTVADKLQLHLVLHTRNGPSYDEESLQMCRKRLVQ